MRTPRTGFCALLMPQSVLMLLQKNMQKHGIRLLSMELRGDVRFRKHRLNNPVISQNLFDDLTIIRTTYIVIRRV